MRTATQIKALTQRQRLQARSAPYYNSIAPRRLLGYIRHRRAHRRVLGGAGGDWA